MIIDQLPEISTVQETDEIPVERGTTTYKSTLQKLKDLVASLLTKADIGLGNVANKDLSNVDNVRQYSAENPPPTKLKIYSSENLLTLYNDVNSNGYIMFGCGGSFTSLLTNGDATSQGYGYAIKTPAGYAEGLFFVSGKVTQYSFRIGATGTLELKSKVQFTGF